LASIYMLSTYRSTFTHTALPDLVGLHGTPWFVLGLAIALVATVRRLGPVLFVAGVTWFALSWGDLGAIRSGLHETAWSIALLEWLVLAGIVGAGRRSLLRSAGLAGWLGFAIGHAAGRGYDGVAFWQSLSIAAPAIAVLLSSLGLLVPRLRPAPAARPADAP
ncbi:MAG: hypothetical protein ACRDM1_13085, partial [Gaiellaceae bacterium]